MQSTVYLEPGEEMYIDLKLEYNNVAKYVLIFS